MNDSFHYLSMANHMMVQKKLMEQLKDTGLTLGQPKVLDYLKDHDGASQKEIAAGCLIEAGSLTSILIVIIQTFRIITILITYVNIIFKIYWNSVQKRELFLFQSAQNTGKITRTNV